MEFAAGRDAPGELNSPSAPFSSVEPTATTATHTSSSTCAVPSSILIIGSGVFGLSTALALAKRPAYEHTTITVVDRAPGSDKFFPARDAASIDSSRIIRADYADPAYSALAAEAQRYWRQQGDDELGGQGRYTEAGLVLVADADNASSTKTSSGQAKRSGMDYVRESWANVVSLAKSDPSLHGRIHELPDADAIRSAVRTGGSSGSWGYLNAASGWADADASMRWLHDRVVDTGRVSFVPGTVTTLVRDDATVTGATLADGTTLSADLVVLAAGAWTGSLVDLGGQATATGQCLGYINITPEEEALLAPMPTLLNLTTGLFVIPPTKGVLKVARHSYGYLNPASAQPLRTATDDATPASASISVPATHTTDPNLSLPAEGVADLRAALREMVPIPAIHDRPFSHTRLCWYTDTPTGDFIIDYHPYWRGLFLATGGSGHGFKFLPVLGDKIVDCLGGQCPIEFRDKWAWKKGVNVSAAIATEDGSRGGRPGLVLREQLGL